MSFDQIWNKYFFTSLDGMQAEWALHADGLVLGSGKLTLPRLDPGEKHRISLDGAPWCHLWQTSEASEIFLTIKLRLTVETPWAEKGHEVACEQLSLPAKTPKQAKVQVLGHSSSPVCADGELCL